ALGLGSSLSLTCARASGDMAAAITAVPPTMSSSRRDSLSLPELSMLVVPRLVGEGATPLLYATVRRRAKHAARKHDDPGGENEQPANVKESLLVAVGREGENDKMTCLGPLEITS